MCCQKFTTEQLMETKQINEAAAINNNVFAHNY